MEYNLEDIRLELYDDADLYVDEALSFELLIESAMTDIYLENRITDAIKSSIDSFKKFIKKLIGWVMYATNKCYRQSVKLKNKMLELKDILEQAVKNIKGGSKTATEASDSLFAEDDPQIKRTMEAINTFISVVMAQHVLAWKMMTVGPNKGRYGWDNGTSREDNFMLLFLFICAIFACAACPLLVLIFVPAVIFELLTRGWKLNEQNDKIDEMLRNTTEELLGTIIGGWSINSILTKVERYRERVHIHMRNRGGGRQSIWKEYREDTLSVVREVLQKRDWVKFDDLQYDAKPLVKKLTKNMSESRYKEMVSKAVSELEELAAKQPTKDDNWTYSDILHNMDTLRDTGKTMFEISLEFQKVIDKQIKSLHKQDYRFWNKHGINAHNNTYREYLDRQEDKYYND